MQFTMLLTVVAALSGMAVAAPVAQAGAQDYTVSCSSGTCTAQDLEGIAKAIELASTNPDSVTWSVVDNGSDKKLAVTRDEASALVSKCAAGNCSDADIEALKKAYEAAQISQSDMIAAGFLGSLDFTYGFKYQFANASSV